MKGVAILALGGLLAACGGGGGTATLTGNSTATAGTAARDPVEDKINALNDVQRKIAFYRAILDSDFTCKKVVKYESKPRDGDRPVWLVTCDDGGEYTVALQPGGIFTVSGVPHAGPRFPKATATAVRVPPAR